MKAITIINKITKNERTSINEIILLNKALHREKVIPDDINVRFRPLHMDFFFGDVPMETDKIPEWYSCSSDWEHFSMALNTLISGKENIMFYMNETYAAKSWIGKNFQDWCALAPEDNRKIFYDKTPCGKFTSDDFCGFEVMETIRNCNITAIKLLDLGWHVELELE